MTQFMAKQSAVNLVNFLLQCLSLKIMDSFEKKIMPKLYELGVKCLFRYVDEKFVVLNKKTNLSWILDNLNSQNLSIKCISNSISFILQRDHFKLQKLIFILIYLPFQNLKFIIYHLKFISNS